MIFELFAVKKVFLGALGSSKWPCLGWVFDDFSFNQALLLKHTHDHCAKKWADLDYWLLRTILIASTHFLQIDKLTLIWQKNLNTKQLKSSTWFYCTDTFVQNIKLVSLHLEWIICINMIKMWLFHFRVHKQISSASCVISWYCQCQCT